MTSGWRERSRQMDIITGGKGHARDLDFLLFAGLVNQQRKRER
jgi:hypothetical protein